MANPSSKLQSPQTSPTWRFGVLSSSFRSFFAQASREGQCLDNEAGCIVAEVREPGLGFRAQGLGLRRFVVKM